MSLETPIEYTDNGKEIEEDLKFLENEIQAFQAVFDELTGEVCIHILRFILLFQIKIEVVEKVTGTVLLRRPLESQP